MSIFKISILILRSCLRAIICAALPLFLTKCAKNTSDSANLPAINKISTISFRVNMPSMPNKKFSAYVFKDGNLKGVALSDTTTDAAGKAEVNLKKVDANNCITSSIMDEGGGDYTVHYRIDSTNTGNFVYPSSCSGTAGFLNDAQLGSSSFYTVNPSSTITILVSAMSATTAMQFNVSGTGLVSQSRNTYCSILDGNTVNPTIYTTSTMGYSQGSVSYDGSGFATVTMVSRINPTVNAHKYACWLDFNNSGTYNSGDKIASGMIVGSTTAVSTWATVP